MWVAFDSCDQLSIFVTRSSILAGGETKNSNDMTSLHSLFLKLLKGIVLKNNVIIKRRNVLDILPLEVITRPEVDPILCDNCHSRAFVKTLSRMGVLRIPRKSLYQKYPKWIFSKTTKFRFLKSLEIKRT